MLCTQNPGSRLNEYLCNQVLLFFYSDCNFSGFSGVECADPYSVAINELVKAKEDANIEQVLINSFQGIDIVSPAWKKLRMHECMHIILEMHNWRNSVTLFCSLLLCLSFSIKR